MKKDKDIDMKKDKELGKLSYLSVIMPFSTLAALRLFEKIAIFRITF